MDTCVFCNEPLSNGQPTTTLTTKGCDGITKGNEMRSGNISTVHGQAVHTSCRKDFCRPTSICSAGKREHATSESSSRLCTRRSTSPAFQYIENCLFCGHSDKYHGKEKVHKLISVLTVDFKCNVMKSCTERNDSWAETVRGRIEYAQDLHAVGAVYHDVCSTNFRTDKEISQQFMSEEMLKHKRVRYGRPSDLERTNAFNKVAAYLEENDDEQTTINNLIVKMKEFLADTDCEPYGFTFMKQQLLKHFADKITITDIKGRSNVVTFRNSASAIIQEFYYQPKKSNSDEEKMRLIETAAKLIKRDVKALSQSEDHYPNSGEMAFPTDAMLFLPESLQLLLQTLVFGKNTDKKIASLGQAIIQCIRPRGLIAPLQIGLGVQLHHHFASKFLIESLHEHGFCSSYKEVKKFESSAAVSQRTYIEGYSEGQFIQYVADNVDHNIRTIDGLNTFHGMGIIATVTPSAKIVRTVSRISVTMEDVAALGRINIRHLTSPCIGLASLSYESLDLKENTDRTSPADLLWKISLTLRWSGTMQVVNTGTHPGQSSVHLLPMIDLNPGDMTCIYSTLVFVCNHARRYNATPIITFDQPLWWKALVIIESEPEDSALREMVLRLGGFHMLMSFLGAIGHIMAGSGLRRVLELVYADNTVTHMLSGKAYARAFRGHLLVDAALNAMLSAKLFGTLVTIASQTYENHGSEGCSVGDTNPYEEADMTRVDDDIVTGRAEQITTDTLSASNPRSVCSDTEMTTADLPYLATQYDALLIRDVVMEDNCLSDLLQRINSEIQGENGSMKDLRTAQLWLQYMDMVDIMRQFITSERTGDWKLHLQVMHDMLPYLAAAGHNSYTKSIYMYLHRLAKLPEQHPDGQRHFENGFV